MLTPCDVDQVLTQKRSRELRGASPGATEGHRHKHNRDLATWPR
jgi:hypothetical protein